MGVMEKPYIVYFYFPSYTLSSFDFFPLCMKIFFSQICAGIEMLTPFACKSKWCKYVHHFQNYNGVLETLCTDTLINSTAFSTFHTFLFNSGHIKMNFIYVYK